MLTYKTSESFADLDLLLTGTRISCSKNDNKVRGSGTSFDTELVSGDKIQIFSASISQVLIVDEINSAESMSLTKNWTGEHFTGSINSSSEGSYIHRKRSFLSSNYQQISASEGTELLINPRAVSGSSADENKNVTFIYRGGLSGPPKRF